MCLNRDHSLLTINRSAQVITAQFLYHHSETIANDSLTVKCECLSVFYVKMHIFSVISGFSEYVLHQDFLFYFIFLHILNVYSSLSFFNPIYQLACFILFIQYNILTGTCLPWTCEVNCIDCVWESIPYRVQLHTPAGCGTFPTLLESSDT